MPDPIVSQIQSLVGSNPAITAHQFSLSLVAASNSRLRWANSTRIGGPKKEGTQLEPMPSELALSKILSSEPTPPRAAFSGTRLNSWKTFARSLPLNTGLLVFLAPALALSQNAAPAATAAQPPVAYTSVSELNGILTPLQQTAQSMQNDLMKTRIEKWKTDNSTKQQTLATVESIRRNLQGGLPDNISQLNNAPEDLAASFKLYRNLVVLYDSFYSVVESAGAFGAKDEFQSLSNDLNGLDNARRAFADRMQKLATGKEEELTRLRAEVKTLSAAPPPPPKKIVVDDTEPAKKPPAKKKVAKPKPPTPATDTPPSTTPPQQ